MFYDHHAAGACHHVQINTVNCSVPSICYSTQHPIDTYFLAALRINKSHELGSIDDPLAHVGHETIQTMDHGKPWHKLYPWNFCSRGGICVCDCWSLVPQSCFQKRHHYRHGQEEACWTVRCLGWETKLYKALTKNPDNRPDAEETMTVREYDINELTKLCTRAFMVWWICRLHHTHTHSQDCSQAHPPQGLCLGMLMHIKFKFDEPLLLQAIMLPMQTVSAPIVCVHLWGHPAVGNLKRPFPEPNPLAALMGGDSSNNATPSPSTARAPSTGPQVAVGSRPGSTVTQRKPAPAST